MMTGSPQRHFYMLPPRNFRIEYIINQWMHEGDEVDPQRAMQEWQTLVDTYQELGAQVEIIELDDPRPDHVFLGDSIFLYGDQALASHFRHPERAAEVEPVVAEFEARGYQVHRLPEGLRFEGNGDNVYWQGHVLSGYGQRSDREAHAIIEETLGLPVVSLEVQAPHFHVDTTITPLNESTLAYIPSALSPESVERVRGLGADLIEISAEEGLLLAGNCITVDGTVVLSTDKATDFMRDLEAAGFQPRPLDMSEFAKSGGGVKCLTLEAYSAKG